MNGGNPSSCENNHELFEFVITCLFILVCIYFSDLLLFLSFFFEALHGNPAVLSVITGNSMAEIVGRIILPIILWLGLKWIGEQPVPCPKLLF